MNPRLLLSILAALSLASPVKAESPGGGHEFPAARPGRPANGRAAPNPASGGVTRNPVPAQNSALPDALSVPKGSDQAPFAAEPDLSDNAVPGQAPAPAAAPAAKPASAQADAAPITVPPPIPQVATPRPPLQLTELFSVEQNPGQGLLDYNRGAESEKIEFGATTGRFAVGMVFRGESLPELVARNIQKRDVFQIALGTLRSRLAGQTPQFGALTVITQGKTQQGRTRYELKMPSVPGGRVDAGALMLFTSPASPVEQSDEEKLKSTYFAQSGVVTLMPMGKPKVLDIKAGGKLLTFRQQAMQMEINARLVTPFNAQEATLSGTVEFPLYWSEDRSGDALAKQIARESFGIAGTGGISVVDEPAEASRGIASPAQKGKKKASMLPDRGM